MTFGEKLYRLRKERKLSQEALASELNVSRQAISRWELEEVVPDTANVLAISRMFGVSTDYLLRDDCDSENDTPAVQISQLAMVPFLLQSVKILWLHYGLGWRGKM